MVVQSFFAETQLADRWLNCFVIGFAGDEKSKRSKLFTCEAQFSTSGKLTVTNADIRRLICHQNILNKSNSNHRSVPAHLCPAKPPSSKSWVLIEWSLLLIHLPQSQFFSESRSAFEEQSAWVNSRKTIIWSPEQGTDIIFSENW